MKIVVVVEGEVCEVLVYAAWIPLVNPRLSRVNDVFELREDTFVIVSGFGYPSYIEVIRAALLDAKAVGADRVVIGVDSEEMSYAAKFQEIDNIIKATGTNIDVRIIIQECCFETWALGNRKVFPVSPRTPRLKEFKKHYNVRSLDPQGMPGYRLFGRVQLAERYLRAILQDRNRKLTYTKGNPKAVAHPKYFHEVKTRHVDTGHISSFSAFLSAFG